MVNVFFFSFFETARAELELYFARLGRTRVCIYIYSFLTPRRVLSSTEEIALKKKFAWGEISPVTEFEG